MSEEKGIKETVEVLQVVLIVAELVFKELRGDGLQVTDAVKIALSSEFREKLAEAVAGAGEVPAELQDLSRIEAIDLALFALNGAKAIVANSLARAA
ncbi:MAG: hypothetical protein M3Q07_22260 [Pseudobdellovibrionaceae bacterium]|nr:hypothetical protein [Pseudobdellovibrionaceae bacterium]